MCRSRWGHLVGVNSGREVSSMEGLLKDLVPSCVHPGSLGQQNVGPLNERSFCKDSTSAELCSRFCRRSNRCGTDEGNGVRSQLAANLGVLRMRRDRLPP